MAIFGRFMINSTGSTAKSDGTIRIYIAGDCVSTHKISSRFPIGYIRKHNGKHRQRFLAILREHGATQEEIDAIMNVSKEG